MKKLIKLLCAVLAWALLLGAAVSCAKQPDSPVQDTPKQEDPQPAPAAGLRIAVDSEPAWSAAVQWFASEQGQALFGDADVHDVFFLVDPQDITQQLGSVTMTPPSSAPTSRHCSSWAAMSRSPFSGTP